MMPLRSSSLPAVPSPSAATEVVHALDLRGARPRIAIACVLAAMALVVHSAAAVQVALPALAHAFEVTPAAAVRVVTAYQMALVMALLPCAALGESLGHRRVFTLGIALFTCASLSCAFAPSLDWLVASRFAQGLGGAAVMALGAALLRFSVPRARLAAAIGWNALTVALSSAAGPATGTLLLASVGLPWLFAVHIPLGAAVLFATRGLPDVEATARKLDVTSIALNAAVFAAWVVAMERMAAAPVQGISGLAASALLLTVLVHRERPKKSPLVPLDLLRGLSFRSSVLASICCFAGQTAALVALPFHLQQGLARDALATGLLIAIWPLSVAIMAPIAGRLADRVPSAWLCAGGGLGLTLGLGALALWPVERGARVLLPFIALAGAGFGLFQVPNNRNMLLTAPRERSAAAGGAQGTARLLGQTLGALIMTWLFLLTPGSLAPRIGFGIGAVLTLGAGILSASCATPNWRAHGTSQPETSRGFP